MSWIHPRYTPGLLLLFVAMATCSLHAEEPSPAAAVMAGANVSQAPEDEGYDEMSEDAAAEGSDGEQSDAEGAAWHRIYIGCEGSFHLERESGYGIFRYRGRCYARKLSYKGLVPACCSGGPSYRVYQVEGLRLEFAFSNGYGCRTMYSRHVRPATPWRCYQCACRCRHVVP